MGVIRAAAPIARWWLIDAETIYAVFWEFPDHVALPRVC